MWVSGAGSPSRWRGFGCFSVQFRIDFAPMCTNLTVLRHSPNIMPGTSRVLVIASWMYGSCSRLVSLPSRNFSVRRSRKTVKSVHPCLIGSSASASGCALFDCVRYRLAVWMQECIQEIALPVSVHSPQLKPDVQLSGDLTSELIETVSVCDAAFSRSNN